MLIEFGMINKTIDAIIFDWAGTMIDHGCFGPVIAFQKTFTHFDIETSVAECRAPMGLPKRDHIKAMIENPVINERIIKKTGREINETDLEAMYQYFLSINEDIVLEHISLIEGVVDTVSWLRSKGIKVGSNSGYGRRLMERILPIVAEAGYRPDNLVCGDDLSEGRPSPLMMYRCFSDLGVYPPSKVIKVDDTAPGIMEGIAAGTLTIGVTLTGNHVGLTADELEKLDDKERDALHEDTARHLRQAGAHYIIRHVSELPSLLVKM